MKLLVVTQYFAPENFRVNDLVKGMSDRGHQVTVLTGVPNYPAGQFFSGYGWLGPRREHMLGADVLRVPLVARGNGSGWRLALNYLSFAWFASVAAQFRLEGRFDAIFVFEPSPITVCLPALVAAKRFKVPVLLWVLDLWPESLQATGAVRSPRLLRQVARGVAWIYAGCSRILVQSQAFFPSVSRLGVPESRIHYFPNWIEPEYIPSEGGEEQVESDRFTIVYAGNIGVAQDFPAILEAAERAIAVLPRVRFKIAGEGRMAGWAKEEVARRGLQRNFEFLGQLPPAAMPSLFANASALLVSLRPEPALAATIPGKVQSYLASGRPLLAMLDGEGSRVVAESGSGLAVNAGDAVALADAIIRMASIPVDELNQMGQRGINYASREFGREILLGRLEAWLSEAIKEQNGEKEKI